MQPSPPDPGLPAAPPIAPGATAQMGVRPGINGFAIASLILGLIGGVLLSVIFGIVALVQLRRVAQGGKRLAIAGLVLSGAWALIIGTVLVMSIGTDDGPSRGWSAVDSVKDGDCVTGVKDGTSVERLRIVPCGQPHQAEVYAVFTVTGARWPGDTAIEEEAGAGCQDRLAPLMAVVSENESLELLFLRPTKRSWLSGDRSVRCLLTDPGGQRTGSLRD